MGTPEWVTEKSRAIIRTPPFTKDTTGPLVLVLVITVPMMPA